MKNLIFLTSIFIFLFLSGCKSDDNVTQQQPQTNHSLFMYNQPMTPPYCMGLQFIKIIITPVDGSFPSQTYSFVLNPSEKLEDFGVYVKTTYQFKIEVFEPNGGCIWWNSMAMTPGGRTTIRLYGSGQLGSYCDGSTCNNTFPPDGCTLPCH